MILHLEILRRKAVDVKIIDTIRFGRRQECFAVLSDKDAINISLQNIEIIEVIHYDKICRVIFCSNPTGRR